MNTLLIVVGVLFGFSIGFMIGRSHGKRKWLGLGAELGAKEAMRQIGNNPDALMGLAVRAFGRNMSNVSGSLPWSQK